MAGEGTDLAELRRIMREQWDFGYEDDSMLIRSAADEIERLRAALFRLHSVAVAMRFQPDRGQPHPLKDGIVDKAIADTALLLADYEPAHET